MMTYFVEKLIKKMIWYGLNEVDTVKIDSFNNLLIRVIVLFFLLSALGWWLIDLCQIFSN